MGSKAAHAYVHVTDEFLEIDIWSSMCRNSINPIVYLVLDLVLGYYKNALSFKHFNIDLAIIAKLQLAIKIIWISQFHFLS